VKFKTNTFFKFFFLALKKGFILSIIILYPTIFLKFISNLSNKPIENIIYGQISNLSLVFIGAAFTQILFEGIRFTAVTTLAYFIFPVMVLGFTSIKELFFELNIIQQVDEINIQDSITLVISFLYFLLVNTSIEINKTQSNATTHVIQYSFEIKTPPFIRGLLHIKNQLLKNILYVLLRLFFYTSLSMLLTFLVLKYFPFEKSIPNYFTVFSTIWTVFTFVSELFITRMKKVDR